MSLIDADDRIVDIGAIYDKNVCKFLVKMFICGSSRGARVQACYCKGNLQVMSSNPS